MVDIAFAEKKRRSISITAPCITIKGLTDVQNAFLEIQSFLPQRCKNHADDELLSCADRLAPLIGTVAGLRPIHMPSELSQSSDSLAKQKITINWWEWSEVSFLLTKNISAKCRKKSCWQDSHGTLCLKCFRNAQLEVCHVALARCDSKSDPWLHAPPGIQYAVRLNKLRKCFCSVFFSFFGNAVHLAPTVEILASFLTLAVHHDRKFQ